MMIKYFPKKYCGENCDSTNKIGSLDVANLLTKVHDLETIEINLKIFYDNDEFKAPKISQKKYCVGCLFYQQ